jgi:L-asparagine transporter-like permease
MKNEELVDREGGLHHGLSRAQITMIGLGGAIGTGLFMGSGIAIGYAGPAVLISYLIAAVAAVIMVFSLSEMAVVHPTAGSFGTYAEMYLCPWAGFLVRYTYWMAQVVAIGGEAVAGGLYMTYWFPGSPVWMWSLGFAIALIYINSRSVTNFGSFEYWFALIKVVAIIVFIILGTTYIFGWVGEPVGLHNLTGLEGGFMPHGFSGVWMAVIMAIFSFYGIEVIAVTSGEAKDPVKAIPAALRTMAARLILFYVLALTIMVTFMPWTEIGSHVVTESPFVKLFSSVGIMYAAGIMNFVVLTAALSSMNTNIYLTSRMLFSLSRGSYAPSFLGKLSANGTPVAATVVSGGCILIAASVSRLTPYAYNYLFGISLFGGLSVWVIILLSHLRFRRKHKSEHLPVRTPFFPYLQIFGIALLASILITMGLDTDFWNISWIVGIPWMIAVSMAYLVWKRVHRDKSGL